MSSSATTHGAVPHPGDGVRPLPPKPDLQFERKRAKKLLRQARRGDHDAERLIGAVRAPGSAVSGRTAYQLADAQFAIAREYGFSSWPKLVTYYESWDRQTRGAMHGLHDSEFYEHRVHSILAGHGAQRPLIGRVIATFVPRFYGKRNEEIFATTLTEADARVVVTREARCSSWAELCDRVATASPLHTTEALYQTPFGQALLAIRARDVARLGEILDAHPDLLKPATAMGETDSLVRSALLLERRDIPEAARRITDFLVARGADLTEPLNRTLTHQFNTRPEDTAYWLDRGADPKWMPPNGISVLEHALLRYWNGDAVDLIARRVVAPQALWVAAGLGDVDAVASYFDRRGALTAAAHQSRPDFTAVGPSAAPCAPDASDDEILWEAFLVAALNGRLAVLDALVARGVDIDAAPWGLSLLHFAVGNLVVELVEHLVQRGANLDLEGWRPNQTPREMAAERYQSVPNDRATKRIYEICHARNLDDR